MTQTKTHQPIGCVMTHRLGTTALEDTHVHDRVVRVIRILWIIPDNCIYITYVIKIYLTYSTHNIKAVCNRNNGMQNSIKIGAT